MLEMPEKGHFKRDCPERDSSDKDDCSGRKSFNVWGDAVEER